MNKYNEEDIKNELRSLFLLREDNSSPFLLVTSRDYPCYYIARDGWKGVGMIVDSNLINFSYKFENIRVKVVPELIANENVYMLELLTNRDFDLYNFAIICLDFLNPGEKGISRKKMLEDPQLWIDSWRDLLGNRSLEERVYPFLGELIVLNYLRRNNEPQLTTQGSHDIETPNANYEVKTTTMRYLNQIEVHSKYQLKSMNNKPLYLYFVRLEESMVGVSINSILTELKDSNYDISKINFKIKEMNSEDLNKCYKINEIKEYLVDDSFPKITDDSFVDGKLPDNIPSIKYTVTLDGLNYNVINY